MNSCSAGCKPRGPLQAQTQSCQATTFGDVAQHNLMLTVPSRLQGWALLPCGNICCARPGLLLLHSAVSQQQDRWAAANIPAALLAHSMLLCQWHGEVSCYLLGLPGGPRLQHVSSMSPTCYLGLECTYIARVRSGSAACTSERTLRLKATCMFMESTAVPLRRSAQQCQGRSMPHGIVF